MKKKHIGFVVLIFMLLLALPTSAQPISYTVKAGDSMWKIAVKYEVGLNEIISQNPQIENPAMIYPEQKLSIPDLGAVKLQENTVMLIVNEERAKHGLQTLAPNWQLSRVARYKSQNMIDKNYFAHNSPTYGSPFRMMETFGLNYSSAGENIAMGQNTPSAVMIAWMNSPGHRANILSPSYTEIGVGLARDKNGKCYWTQMFIKPLK